ncbi:hypothetical protein D3C72_612260 [compost metagenome]
MRQIAHPVLQGPVQAGVEQVPVQAEVVVPLLPLAELAAHEGELLARVAGHEAEQQAQVGELLPGVAGHLVEQRLLEVHHLVVREGQHELLGQVIHDAEGQVVVVEAAVDRVHGHVLEDVVHPAHVPLEVEAQPALGHRAGHLREGGRLLGDRDDVGEVLVNLVVGVLDELDGFQVLAPAVLVGHPVPALAAVVQVQHRGDRVHAQPVDVVLVQPEERVRDQEVPHLGAAEVEDHGVPLGVLALAGIGVLVEVRAVEVDQAVAVVGEVGGHPVQDHADAGLVQRVDQVLEVVGGAEAAGGREVAHHLVAPGAVEGVLGDRQQLDVGVAELFDVLDQLGRHLLVRQPGAVGVRVAHPRAQMQLVDVDGRLEGVGLGPLGHPVGVVPLVGAEVPDLGGRRGANFAREAVGVGLLHAVVVDLRADAVLVDRARLHAGDEGLPDARAGLLHGVGVPLPLVEVADHRDLGRVRRPDREVRARHAVELARVRAQLLVGAVVGAFGQQVDVELGQKWRRHAGILPVRRWRRVRPVNLVYSVIPMPVTPGRRPIARPPSCGPEAGRPRRPCKTGAIVPARRCRAPSPRRGRAAAAAAKTESSRGGR